jgi:Uma2 family endonuclease
VVNLLNHLLSRAIGDAAIVAAQNPIVLGEHSEPQPDIVLLKPRDDFYRRSHPGPDDVLLLIEVADTSAPYDRLVKVPLYARHGIREVWILDLPQKRLEVYRQPRRDHGEYQRFAQYRDGRVSPEMLPEVALSITDLLLP